MSARSLQVRVRLPLSEFDLDVEFATGERVLGIFGPSGAGKTSLLEVLAGLRRGGRGRIVHREELWLDSDRGVFVAPEERGIGYVPQQQLLFPHRDVAGNLRAGGRRAIARGEDLDRRVADVAATLGIEALLGRRPEELSGGERQRVALGRALCSGPRLLVLDEPLASLDLGLRHRILPYLIRARDRFGVPMVVVSHDPVELLALADELVALDRGRVMAQGDPAAVFARPDVYRTAAAGGFENVLAAVVVGHEEHVSRVRLGGDGGGPELVILRAEAAVGTAVTLGLPADDIVVARQPVSGVSARNRLPATVVATESVDHQRIVTVRLEGLQEPALLVELTVDAVAEMGGLGDRVWLLIKSSSISLYG